MEKEKTIILSALGAGLFGRELRTEVEVDWEAMLKECSAQSVLPFVYQQVKDLLPGEIRSRWEVQYLRCIAKNVQVREGHEKIHRLLTDSNIPYVILKGCASAEYYPQPVLRTLGDVDFLIKKEDVNRCSALLIEAGMVSKEDDTYGYHRAFSFQDVEYELHWEPPGVPAEGEKIRALLADILEKERPAAGDNEKFLVPSLFHHGLLLLLHSVHHITATGIGLRHLCDWAVFVEKTEDEEFCTMYEACLKECGLWEFARVLTAMTVKNLGVREKRWASGVNDELIESLMEDIWTGGNFGKKDRHRMNFGLATRDAKTRKIVDRSLAESILEGIGRRGSEWYPELDRRAVTRPLAWAGVCCRYSWRILTGKRAVPRLRKDDELIRARRELFRRLRLFEDCEE